MRCDISIIICTCNIGERLFNTIRSVLDCHLPENLLAEVVVVINGVPPAPTPDIDFETTDRIALRFEPLHAIGLSRARNHGLQQSSGDIVLWTDDDVVVPQDWIEKLSAPLLSGTADAVVGGWDTPLSRLPNWVRSSNVHGPHNSRAVDFANVQGLIGLNMGFHRSVFDRVPEFDEELGSGSMGFGEDSLYGKQVVEAGFQITGVPEVTVEHLFDTSRINRRSLLDRAKKVGRSDAYVAYHWHHLDRASLGWLPMVRRPVRLWFERFRHALRWHREVEISEAEFAAEMRLAYARYMSEISGTPRKYKLKGLTKLGSQPATQPAGQQSLSTS